MGCCMHARPVSKSFVKKAKHRPSLLSLSLFFVLLLSACGAESGHFVIKGRFQSFNKGDFYVYSPDGAISGIDTIHVSDGRFEYEVPLESKATFVLLFPNLSELPVMGEPGATAKVSGSASHLKEIEITGTDDNDLLTKFRKGANRLTPPEETKSAEQFIKEHSQSPISLYLLKKYFLLTSQPDYAKASSLLAVMTKAQPKDGRLANLKKNIDRLSASSLGKSLPSFAATDVYGKSVGKAQLSARVNVVNVWTTWNFDSQRMQRQLDELKKTHGSKLAVVGICLDGRSEDCKRQVERDSIRWPNVCDGQMWQSPLVAKFGLSTVPGNIVYDSKGKVVATNLDASRLKEKIESLLK